LNSLKLYSNYLQMNKLNLKSYFIKHVLLFIFLGFTQFSKAQNDIYTKFNSELTLNDSLFLSVYNSFNVKEDWGKLKRNTYKKSCFVRLYLSNNEIVRGKLLGYHKNGLFVYNSYYRTIGFYPFCRMDKLKFGHSPFKVILSSSLGILGFCALIGTATNNSEYAAPVALGGSAFFQGIFLPTNELIRYLKHSNWKINKDKNKGEELYNFILNNKKLSPTARNLTGIVD